MFWKQNALVISDPNQKITKYSNPAQQVGVSNKFILLNPVELVVVGQSVKVY